MNILSFVNPFSDGVLYKKRNLKEYKDKAGVYFIKENGVVVYVGMSESCVVEAMYRHFYRWKDWRHERVTYYATLQEFDYECAIMVLEKEVVHKVERALIFSMRPRDNKEYYDDYFTSKVVENLEEQNDLKYEQTGEQEDDGLPF